MKQFIIMALEPLESRYTTNWFTHLPVMFQQKLGSEYDVFQITGSTTSEKPTEGAFLDFAATNMWKNEQASRFFEMLKENEIEDDAIILFTDAWNPCILQFKYTKDLLKKNWTMIGIWHAGSYIDQDPLGQLIPDKTWSYGAEKSFYNSLDINWFATWDHFEHFLWHFNVKESKAIRSGFPMEYIEKLPFPVVEKTDTIVFAARNSPEKQPEIFYKLKEMRPQYNWINTIEHNFTREQYQNALAESKVTVSFSLLETLGIIQHEALKAGSIPMVPSHLCYQEEYMPGCSFVYNDKFIKGNINYTKLIQIIDEFIINHEKYATEIKHNLDYQRDNYFSCDLLIQKIKG